MNRLRLSATGRLDNKMSSVVDWHARYSQQARWTANVRNYLFDRAGIGTAQKILEVGCGTGALLSEFPSFSKAGIFGLDIVMDAARQSQRNAQTALITCGDGIALPYPDQTFDIVFCHFLLLWVKSPVDIMKEMKRVVQRGGAIIALAEPDYAGRIDYPPTLEPLGRWQAESLRRQGADPDAGRKLHGWFSSAGIPPIESGIIAGGWSAVPSSDERALEWVVIESDLAGQVPAQDIQKLKNLDEAAWTNGERVLFVPTFYAWGRT
jgi:ubiquinone/menaquinone biosynthesis C-methylase UbiE